MSRTTWIALASLLCAGTLAAHAAPTAAALDFDKVFNDRAEPAQAHYTATYRLGAGEHRIEVWRDRELRVRRRTDDAIDTFAVRPAGEIEWSITVLDLQRRIRTDVDRTNLFRIGHVTDWFALSHSLARPAGPYTLAALPRVDVPPARPVATCRWFALTQGERVSKICWSARQRIALLITDASDAVQWRVVASDTKPLPDATFTSDDRGFVRNDANRDIQAD